MLDDDKGVSLGNPRRHSPVDLIQGPAACRAIIAPPTSTTAKTSFDIDAPERMKYVEFGQSAQDFSSFYNEDSHLPLAKSRRVLQGSSSLELTHHRVHSLSKLRPEQGFSEGEQDNKAKDKKRLLSWRGPSAGCTELPNVGIAGTVLVPSERPQR